jgi:hypothetical protein
MRYFPSRFAALGTVALTGLLLSLPLLQASRPAIAAQKKAPVLLDLPSLLGKPEEVFVKKFGKRGEDFKYKSDKKGTLSIFTITNDNDKVNEVLITSAVAFKTPDAYLKALGINLRGKKPIRDETDTKIWSGKTPYAKILYIRMQREDVAGKPAWVLVKVSDNIRSDSGAG